ncbi:SEL1-like repeat protein [Noviherbaspirillum sp. ST9]|uniref:SEL1-like repeat protein n=1 Tax=Noviherbaspirillum sp. ST9 TaxID=3401606 RepID=UPI003B585CDC
MNDRVCILKSPVPDDDGSAWAYLHTVLERRDDESCLPPDPVFLLLAERLAARVPAVGDIDAGCSAAVLGRIEENMCAVVESANALGLVVFDGPKARVFRPPLGGARYGRDGTTELVRVAITGIREGFTQQRAAELLAPLFKRTEAEVRRLLSLPRPVVKSGVSRETAQKYVDALERCGCTCALQVEGAEMSLLRDSPMAQCRKQAEAGDAQAQFDLGCMHFGADGEDRDWAQALHWWRKAAEQGHGAALSNLAWLYHAGQDVPQDLAQSIACARQAADLGLAGAQFFLGERVAKGEGVEKDTHQAAQWYRKAAEQGHAVAQFRLGVRALESLHTQADALLWFRKSAALGYAPAQHNLGVMHERGIAVGVDAACAARWYRRAALQGYAASQYNLAVMHSEGRGVAQDFREAAEWYRPAAEQGHANAQFNLARAYHSGEGVAQDDTLAAHWFSRCAERGDADAQYLLGMKYCAGLGVPCDLGKGFDLVGRAAAQGHREARAQLDSLHDAPPGRGTWLH